MIRLLLGCLLAITASACPYFTPSQVNVLRIAYAVGAPYDLGYSMAAITWQESFGCRPGVAVCTENLSDGSYGSYGVCQMQITTYAWHYHRVDAQGFTWGEWAPTAQRLKDDPVFALESCAGYLYKHLQDTGSYRAAWARYNGGGQAAARYAEQIAVRVRTLQECGL